jgi:hypothetical protein
MTKERPLGQYIRGLIADNHEIFLEESDKKRIHRKSERFKPF